MFLNGLQRIYLLNYMHDYMFSYTQVYIIFHDGGADSILREKDGLAAWHQVRNEDLDMHRRKLPWSPADQNNININEENNFVKY